MDRVTILAVCVVGFVVLGTAAEAATTAPSTPSHIDQWQDIIGEAAGRFDIPDAWIRGVMQAESGGRARLNGRLITSPKGAMGLMQVMPDTYRNLRVQYGLGSNAYDSHDNIFAGAAYLRQMYDRYGYPLLFAAYNAGPKRFEDFLFGGRALPRETLDYVSGIVPGANIAFSPTADLPPGVVRDASALDALRPAKPHPDGLFFTRKDVNATANSPAETTANNGAGRSNSTNFAATNSAALFVPLAASAR
jgi:hypothetical protein